MINAVCQLGNFIAPGDGQRFGQVTTGNLANVGNDATERIKQDVANAIPHAHQHDDQRQRHDGHLPFGKAVIILALRKGRVIQVATGFGIFPRVPHRGRFASPG